MSDDLRKLLVAGTPRPWEWDDRNDEIRHLAGYYHQRGGFKTAHYVSVASGGSVGFDNAQLNMSEEDAQLAIAAVNSAQALLDRITQLETALREACEIAECLSNYVPKFPPEGEPTMADKRIAELRLISNE